MTRSLLLGAGMVVLGVVVNSVLHPDSLGYGAARLVGVGGITVLLAALLQWARARSSRARSSGEQPRRQ